MTRALAGCLGIAILGINSGGAGRVWQDRSTRQFAAIVTVDAGISTLSGTVLSDDASPRPVRRATVRVIGENLRSPRVVGTDDDGRFVFNALPGGSATLSAAKPGYIQTYYGSTRPGIGPGVPVALPAGKTVEVVLRMGRGAVITGLVVDAFGRPAPSVPVLAVGLSQGPSTAATLGRAATNDRGQYRIFGLPPGDYLVMAEPPLQPIGPGLRRSAHEVLATPDTLGQWARVVAAGRAGSGTLPAPTIPPARGSAVTYAPVYYPGTTNLAAATPVSVEAGGRSSGVGIALQVVPVARIAGRLVDANGRPASPATVSVYPRWREQLSLVDQLAASGALTLPRVAVEGGSFSLAGLAAGDYTLVARSGSASLRASTDAPPGSERLWGLLDVTVTGTDQTNLVLRLVPGIKVTGRVLFEGSSLSRPDDGSSLRLSLVAAGTRLGPASTAVAVVDRDGTFRFGSVVPGRYSLQPTLPAAASNSGWTLKSALLDGRDIADWSLVVEPDASDMKGLEITFTDRAAEISGHLFDASGQPESRYSIVVITTDPDFWRPSSRRIQSVRPATDGSFRVGGLPAGSYAIAAVRDILDVDFTDPTFLSGLIEAGYSLTLGPGATVEQDLRVGGGIF